MKKLETNKAQCTNLVKEYQEDYVITETGKTM